MAKTRHPSDCVTSPAPVALSDKGRMNGIREKGQGSTSEGKPASSLSRGIPVNADRSQEVKGQVRVNGGGRWTGQTS
ncbi:hypothetical protein BaRGS_00007811 [Batillaria attramentaria]|uniref:Uncharacterized protein n=1 Tax=Batillaria attramentaria TaxID=370345 RepID=A0ABD0LNX0_9CAEN